MQIITPVVAFLLLCSSLALAQDLSTKTKLTFRSKKRELVLTNNGKAHDLLVSSSIDAAKIAGAKLLFINRIGNFTYLLADVGGPSKGTSDDRQCGAGEEWNLLWIKLTNSWNVVDIKSLLYESCWRPVSADDPYTIDSGRLQLSYNDFDKNLHYKLVYDSSQPEKGLAIEESTLQSETSN